MQHNSLRKSRGSVEFTKSPEKLWLSENEEKELAQKFNVQLSDATRDLIGKEVWESLHLLSIFSKEPEAFVECSTGAA